MNRWIYAVLLAGFLTGWQEGYPVETAKRKKKQEISRDKVTAPKEDSYKKLFTGKKVKTVKGLMTLHQVDEKVLVEIPVSLFGRDMVLVSKVAEISDHTDCYVGMNPMRPLHVFFTKVGNHVHLRRDKSLSVCRDGSEQIKRAIEMSNIGGTLGAWEIKAYGSDSTSVVLDMTEFFTGDERLLSAIHARSESKLMLMGASYRHVKEGSSVLDVMAFPQNVSIKSCLNYCCTIKTLKRYVTAHAVRTFALLPEKPMQPRIADYRVPLQVVGKYNFKGDYSLMAPVYYALRWRLEPSDPQAYQSGKQVEPVKPIIFYLDTAFNEVMRNGIREGILEWNKTFEAIGFRNVLQVRDFPQDDSLFTPDDFSYNCVRYVPSLAEGVTVQTYADPRSGEILNTTILVCHNFIREIPFNVFLNLAHADPGLRKRYLPDERLEEHVKYYFMWLVGTDCLGMTYNLTSSAAFPVDSLRSASFTGKYGTSPSMLDLAQYNVAAPVDGAVKGIRLVPKGVGEYDYFVVKWLYQPIPGAETAEEELPVLDRWISEKTGNPVYRYEYAKDCPDCGAGDVGDDDLKLYEYSMQNLRFMICNFDQWISDEEDKDYSFREVMYLMLNRKYKQLLTQVATNVYGITTYERKAGDTVPMFRYMSKERQQKALDMLFEQLERPEWMLRPDLLQKMAVRRSVKEDHKDYMMLLLNTIAGKLFAYESAEGEHIRHGDYIRYAYRKLWAKTRAGEDLSPEDIYYQNFFFRTMLLSSKLVDRPGNRSGANQALYASLCNDAPQAWDLTDWQQQEKQEERLFNPLLPQPAGREVMAGNYGTLKKWPVMNVQSSRYVYYAILKEMQQLLKQHMNDGSEMTRQHYRYILDTINRLLD